MFQSKCFLLLQPESVVIQLPCASQHIFHSECVLTWLGKSQQCPICTQNIVHVTEMEKFMDATTGPHNLTPMTESTETHIQKDSQLVEKPESLV